MSLFDYNPYNKQSSKEFKIDIPNVKPLPLLVGASIFAGVSLVGIGIGAAVGTYVFFGCVTLAGLIAISETNKYVRVFIEKTNKFIDLAIFGASIYATAHLGVTLTATLVIAGLGASIVYFPFVRERAKNNNNK